MGEDAKRRFLLLAAYYAVLALAAWLTVRYLLAWLLPFLLALGAAEAIEPAVKWMQRRLRVKRGFASAVVTLALLAVLGGALTALFSALLSESRGALSLLSALPDALAALGEALRERLDTYCALCGGAGELPGDWTRWARTLSETVIARLPALLASFIAALPRFALAAATTVLAVFFFSASLPTLHAEARRRLQAPTRERLQRWRDGAMRSLGQWLRAQAILCLMTFLQLLAAFTLLGVRFAWLTALLITLVDALPVFGTGTVLLPWAVIELLLGSVPRGMALVGTYLCALLVRSVAEPRLLAKRAGVPSVASLAAMYLGFRAFGVGGMLLAPMLLLFAVQLRAADGTA